jgi:hypothetical protein
MKLTNYFNFSSSAISMIRAYLTDPSHCVCVDGMASDSAHITSEVPQSSVLRPLLFSLFMNDISEVMRHCKYHIYADDVQLYISSKYDVIGDCVARLNERIHRWSMSNGLLLNPNKTKAMFICCSRAAVTPPPVVVVGVTIPYSIIVCDLGMTLNYRLTFDDHINVLCSRVHYSLRNLWSP